MHIYLLAADWKLERVKDAVRFERIMSLKVLVRVLNAKFVFVAVFVAPMGCLPLMFCSLATLCIGSVLKEWAHARNSSVAY